MATKFHNTDLYIYRRQTYKIFRKKPKLMEKYIFIKEIGSGSFGKVFLVKSKQQGINYVVKKVDLKKLDKKQRLSAAKEVELLAKLRHNNIVSYKESCEKNDELNIVLEYCENGDLHNKIKEKRINNKFFSENEIFDYFVQISLALEYIHSHKILHRDLKTKNIFLTKGNIIKLGDFGIAKTLENSFELAQTCIGSPFYLSPEICESKPYNKKSDVWALGCVLYELATLRYAFVAKNVKTLISKILTGSYNPLPTNMNIHIRTLISCMLKPDPADRPSVREILGKQFLIKRRAAFVCKAYRNDFYKRRSRSGGRNFPPSLVKNDIQINNLNKSLSCLQLNQNKLNNISNPKAKYDPFNNCQTLKNKLVAMSSPKNFIYQTETTLGNEKPDDCINQRNLNFENVKSIKLPKADSKYYDLIAGYDRSDEKNEMLIGKQKSCVEFNLINLKYDFKKMHKIIHKTFPRNLEEVEEAGDIKKEKGQNKKVPTNRGKEPRKRWLKNTLQKEALLAMFNESKILDDAGPYNSLSTKSGKSDLNQSIDDLLTIHPSEIVENVLQPIQLNEFELRPKSVKKDLKIFQLLQHEINHLREKFELNEGNYDIEDLMRFTLNSKKILKIGLQSYTENDREVEDSVYHNLECLRMMLEREIGFCIFSQVYTKMNNIINDEVDSSLKNCLEKEVDPTKTYVINKVHVSGDGDDLIKNIWKSIIGILGDKKEHLPDIWELAMSENIYYHF